jgi:uridine phosphorylase
MRRVTKTRHILKERVMDKNGTPPPIIRQKAYERSSVFIPENLLREARRQRSIPAGKVPAVCVLDPDGDIVENLLARNRAQPNIYWACYHTKMYDFELDQLKLGIIGYTVGAPFAVLVAEELFACGCKLLINVTSSGQILPERDPPFFVLVEKALRDEGTSYHYIPPSDFVSIDDKLLNLLDGAFSNLSTPVCRGATWTTDAPFRETDHAIRQARLDGILAVEMEAAGLYAFAQARSRPVVCFAHVTNRMGSVEGDFEKGEEHGSRDALQLIAATARTWLAADAGKS